MTRRVRVLILVFFLLFAAGCSAQDGAREKDGRLHITATTTMLADLARELGGDAVVVEGLMGPGIDPHQYQASAGDVIKMQNADLVVYNGLHLEGKMGEIFQALEQRGITVICAGDALAESDLIYREAGAPDPHIWFDVCLWEKAAQWLAKGMQAAAPQSAELFGENLRRYQSELQALHQEVLHKAEELEPSQRILVTAHDAFGYFGRAYGFTVKGIQGISTGAEAGTLDVSVLAQYIAAHGVRAVFVESSVSPRTAEALLEAVRARGAQVRIGGGLYSDSLGGAGSPAETYCGTVRANIVTIVEALKE